MQEGEDAEDLAIALGIARNDARYVSIGVQTSPFICLVVRSVLQFVQARRRVMLTLSVALSLHFEVYDALCIANFFSSFFRLQILLKQDQGKG